MNTLHAHDSRSGPTPLQRYLARGVLIATVLTAPAMAAPTFELVTSAWDTGQAVGGGGGLAISANGRYVAFESSSPRIVRGDSNGGGDVFVRDRRTGTTTLVSVSSSGVQGNNGGATSPGSITADGRYVTFVAESDNLVPGDTNDTLDIFLRDTVAGTTERVNVSSAGVQGDGWGLGSFLSDDGRYVVFNSIASNLIAGQVRHKWSVYLRDRLNRTTTLIGLPNPDAECLAGAFSGNGRYVAMSCDGFQRMYVHDLATGNLEALPIPSGGTFTMYPNGLSEDGRYLVFTTDMQMLRADTHNGVNAWDVYLFDRTDHTTGAFELISVTPKGVAGNARSENATVSGDGRYVAFTSAANDLVAYDSGMSYDAFVRDRATKTTVRVSTTSSGGCCILINSSLSRDGSAVYFVSKYPFTANDTNATWDTFVATNFFAGADAAFTVRPRTLAFGTKGVGATSDPQTVTITNTGSADLSIAWVGLAGDGRSQFARVRDCPGILPAGHQCTASVTFTPTVTGNHEARLVVSAGDARKSAAVRGVGE